MNILAALVALLIAIYGFLIIVGGPQLANQWPGWLYPRLKLPARWIIRTIVDLLRGIGVSVIRFVFYRPRR